MATRKAKAPASGKSAWTVGEKYLVRTATNYLTGRLTAVHTQELVFNDAAWVASTGRFSQALTSGVFDEVEPYPDGPVLVGRGSVVDACVWGHELPRQVK